jgi:Tol biopolymer transport system component
MGGRVRRIVSRLRLAGAATAVVSLLTLDAPARAAFPGENGKIAYVRSAAGSDIFVVNPNGTGRRNLTASPRRNESSPAWSVDGKKLAFMRQEFDEITFDIWVMNAAGRDLVNLTDTPSENDLQPAWSPDGSKIVFVKRYANGGSDLFVLSASGTERQLTFGPQDDFGPAWSPNRRLIAFGRDNRLHLMNADGSGVHRVTDYTESEANPNWAPNGNRIAYAACVSGCEGTAPDWDIFTVKPDGTEGVKLTDGPELDSFPAWSPDGRRIAFARSAEIFVMDADGSDLVQLTSSANKDSLAFAPDWQPLQGEP